MKARFRPAGHNAAKSPASSASTPALKDQTALDRYVAAPDDTFAWKLVSSIPLKEGSVFDVIELTPQTWLTEKEVEKFFVSGASKRGWTTWITAAVDPWVSPSRPSSVRITPDTCRIPGRRRTSARRPSKLPERGRISGPL